MDTRLKVTDPPRAVAPGVQADMPLVTMAWRALRAEHQRRADERRNNDAEARAVQAALASVAEEVYRLEQAAQAVLPALEGAGDPSGAQHLRGIADRLEAALSTIDLSILAPEGELYTGELMELFDNIAQRASPEASEPRIAEVVAPAIIFRGGLLRMGKAVIAVPGGPPSRP